jgi:hypothetical protein
MVMDARDSKTYWVRRIGDLCWMETNLAYAGGGDNRFGDVVDIEEWSPGSGMGNSNARFIRPPLPPDNTPLYTSFPRQPAQGVGAGPGAQYGFLYNWCAAMGGPTLNPNACNLTEDNQANINTNASICPAGWRIPVNNWPTNSEFSDLSDAVGGFYNIIDNWLGVLPGLFGSSAGDFQDNNTGSFYWSSNVSWATGANILAIPSVTGSLPRAVGASIRCVAP